MSKIVSRRVIPRKELQIYHELCRGNAMKMFDKNALRDHSLKLEYKNKLAANIGKECQKWHLANESKRRIFQSRVHELKHPQLNILPRAVKNARFLNRQLKRLSSHLHGDTTDSFHPNMRSHTNPDCDGSPTLMHCGNALQPDEDTINVPPMLRPLHQRCTDLTPRMNGMVGGEGDNRISIKRDILVKSNMVTVLYSRDSPEHGASLQKFIADGFKQVNSPEAQRVKVGTERKYSCVLSSEGTSINVFPKEGHILDVRGLLDGAVERHTFVVMQHCGNLDAAVLNFKISTELVDETYHLFPFTIEMIQKGHQTFAKGENAKQSSSAEGTAALETSARKRIASVALMDAADTDNEDDGVNNTENVRPFKKIRLLTELQGYADGLDLQVYHNLFKLEDITFDMLMNMGHDFLEKIGVNIYEHRARIIASVKHLP